MNSRIISRLKRVAIYNVVLMQAMFLSAPMGLPVYAQESPTETTPVSSESTPETEPVCVAPEGTRRPTGTTALTYTYNCATGLWENDYYTWSPVTLITTARYTPEHRYNSGTGRFEVYEWVYSAPALKYVYAITRSYAPPTQEQPVITQPETNNSEQPPANNSTPVAITKPTTLTGTTIPNGALSIIDYDSGTDISYDLLLNASLTTNINSTATTGEATVLQNTTAQDATSGDAYVSANVINMIQSAMGWQGLQPEVYTADIQGDYFGDIIIDPGALNSTAAGNCSDCNVDINSEINGSIVNNVDLLAQSGNATVSSNTSAGNATTGDTTAVANIVNMISSSIMAGQSFIGVLNVHGNLEGDILMASDVINELIAANVPTVDMGLCSCDLSADLTDNVAIDNNITATASSGNATVANNTLAGDATSGDANTNVTVFNLTNRSVVGRDALLVFVNVAGEWIGFITDAPVGSTAAMLGSEVTNNAVQSDTEINATTNASIQNNVNVGAHSGDANVSYNTSAGNATSGDANANVNVANIANSNFSFGGWFGILFINIFGDWLGSFNTDTQYGDLPTPPAYVPTPTMVPQVAGKHTANKTVRAFAVSFEPTGGNKQSNESATLSTAKEVSSASTDKSSQMDFGSPASNNQDYTLIIMFALMGVAYLVIFRADTLSAIFRRRS